MNKSILKLNIMLVYFCLFTSVYTDWDRLSMQKKMYIKRQYIYIDIFGYTVSDPDVTICYKLQSCPLLRLV